MVWKDVFLFLIIVLLFLSYYPLLSKKYHEKTFEVDARILMKLGFLFLVTAISIVIGELHA